MSELLGSGQCVHTDQFSVTINTQGRFWLAVSLLARVAYSALIWPHS